MGLLEETINLSHLYGVKPSRSRGQNFLVDESIYDDIIKTAHITKEDTILEVCPGLGFLTQLLAKVAKSVIAVELDRGLAEALRNRLELENIKNVSVFNEDVMNFSGEWVKTAAKIPSARLIVVANLPYSITSIFLRHFIGGNRAKVAPERFVLMLQKEVAERITAQAGSLSILALSVQIYADPKIEFIVSRDAFWPKPEVASAIVGLRRTDRWLKILAENKGKEADLLRLLCLKKNEVLVRQEALIAIWNNDSYFNGRSMDVFLSKLRKYLKEDPQVEILNVHGKGFKLIVP